jgi:hypothetical protein
MSASIRTIVIFFVVLGAFFIYRALPFSLQARRAEFRSSPAGINVNNLRSIRVALEQYRAKYGSYPKSVGYSGLRSCWGYSGAKWIPGLVPEFMPALPRDPRGLSRCDSHYLYTSDGSGYKLVAHKPDDFLKVVSYFPEMYDPRRRGFAYGFWSREWRNK